MSIVEQDTYVRPNQSGWNTSSRGHTWANFGDTVNLVLSILNNQGKATGSSNDNWVIIGTNIYGDIDITVRISSTSNLTGNFEGLTARHTDTNNHYRCYLRGNNLYMEKKVAGVVTLLTSAGVNNNVNTEQWIRFRLVGSSLKGKQWLDGTNEPAAWTITATDSALSSGKVGLFISPNATADVTLYDNFTANDTKSNALFGNHRSFGRIV